MDTPTALISKREIVLVAEYLTSKEDQIYNFSCELNFSRKALCFTGNNGGQKIISLDNAKRIALEAKHGNTVEGSL